MCTTQKIQKSKEKTVGTYGEKKAAKYLERRGWHIIAQNYRVRVGELDIVARDPEGVLVFVEVKTLRGNPDALHRLMPEDHLNSHKLSKLRALSAQFANRYPELVHEDKGWRIDLVAVNIGEREFMRHYENIQ